MMEIELLKANLQTLHQGGQYRSRGNETIAGNALAEIERLECELAHVRKVRNDSAEDMRTEIRSLREELAETKARLHEVSLNWQVLAKTALQMRDALKEIDLLMDDAPFDFAIAGEVVHQALTVDTKPAEQIVAKLKLDAYTKGQQDRIADLLADELGASKHKERIS